MKNHNILRSGRANTPIAITNEMQNYFSGQVTVNVEVLDLEDKVVQQQPYAYQVYLCMFNDPVIFDAFLGLRNHSENFICDHDTNCNAIDVTVSRTCGTNYSIEYDIEHPVFSFIGAIQTEPSYVLQFGYHVFGATIIGLDTSYNIQRCTLNGTQSTKCTLFISNEFIKAASGSNLCVLADGVSTRSLGLLWPWSGDSFKSGKN